MSETQYTFWLLPAEPWRCRLRAVINDLAREFNAPEFDPHVTFYHGPSNPDEARDLIETIAADFAPLHLEGESIRHSDRYSKTCYIQFRSNDAARALFQSACDFVAKPADYKFDPHLSLIYQNLTEDQRAQLCRRDLVPLEKIRFDSICAVEFESPWSEKSVRGCEIILEYGLREGFRRRRDDMR